MSKKEQTTRFIIAGAPCAGKSTYVKERAQPGALIYDYDSLHMALSGQGSHEHLTAIRPYVLAAREAVFHELEAHRLQPAWVITSSPKRAELENLAARLNAELIFLEVTSEAAHERAALDQRPESWHAYIDNWFQHVDFDPTSFKKSEVNMKKTYRAAMALKEDGAEGAFKAVFATFNVKDLDGDVTIPGAFNDGKEVVIEPWNHGYELPAGKGVIRQNDLEAWVEGRFILDTQTGRENYLTVKELGPLVEWSYTFDILEACPGDFKGEQVNFLRKLDEIGVSPVTRGAGIATRTIAIKQAAKRALPRHETATSDAAWDGPENEIRVKSGENISYYGRVYAWQDPDGDPEVKSNYRFIHHEISADGVPGAANIKALQSGIGVLNGGMGGTTIPDSDREGVYNHLAAHLRDAELEPPALKTSATDPSATDPGEAGKGKPREYYLRLIDTLEIQTRKILTE